MKFKAKIISAVLAASALLASLSAPALAFIAASEEFYVNDRAEVLSEDTEKTIIEQNRLLEEKTGAQVVVATVRYLEGYYCDEYAVTLFNDWGVGDADKNNGMLLLLATEEKKAWLTQGSGIKKDFSSDYIDKLMDRYFWDDFDNKEYDKAVSNLFDEIIDWYEDEYDIKLTSSSASKKVSKAAAEGIQNAVDTVKTVAGGIGKASIAVVVIVFAIILSIIFGGRSRRRRRNYFTNTPPLNGVPPMHFNHRPTYGGRRTSSSSFRSGSSGFSGRSSSSSRSFGGGHSSFGGGHSGGHSGGGGRSSGGGGGRR